ncbi:MAG: hypothetical protein BEN18_01295 [Epulopiscium sp. Nuni2H_MBin001]|nr:MAG: hypothetical protein BEN18_01295 [Epulopiscium sp. Nuni2H_MBin001]
MNKVELLAPVGKIENMYAAVENGADAIFLGGKEFSARYSAENFTIGEIKEIIKYCKLRGIKVYITVNTLINEAELPKLFGYLEQLQNIGIDALIIQDLGIVRLVQKYFPSLTLHASTQLSVHSVYDAQFLKSHGISRIVLARELTLNEIIDIKNNVDIEIETFVHGALCYSYSGQCLMSSVIGSRSGNRGKCAQPCRMQYELCRDGEIIIDKTHLLSPKDICTLDILPNLIEANITSFKIEGRMKSPEYVASVVKAYRKYIDNNIPSVLNEDLNELQAVFNRGGFSTGYYNLSAGLQMMATKSPKNIGLLIGKVKSYNPKTKLATIYTTKQLNPGDGIEVWNSKKHIGTGISNTYKENSSFSIQIQAEPGSLVYLSKDHLLLKSLRKTYEKPVRKREINAKVYGKIGQPIKYTLICDNIEVCAYGDILEQAVNNPIAIDKIKLQFTKLGATPFKINCIDIEWDDNSYIVISKLNELRREVIEKLEHALLTVNSNQPKYFKKCELANIIQTPQISAKVETFNQLNQILQYENITKVYWEWNYNNEETIRAYKLCRNRNFLVALPAIMRDDIWEKYSLDKLFEYKNMGYLCRTLGQVHYIIANKKICEVDYNLNVTNMEHAQFYLDSGVSQLTLSLETKENLPFQKIIYGHMPVMTTAQCLLGHYKQCGNKGKYHLTDRVGAKWPIITDCKSCTMQILNGNSAEEKLSGMVRLNFSIETERETQIVLKRLLGRC